MNVSSYNNIQPTEFIGRTEPYARLLAIRYGINVSLGKTLFREEDRIAHDKTFVSGSENTISFILGHSNERRICSCNHLPIVINAAFGKYRCFNPDGTISS